MPECVGCIRADAVVEIVLADGLCLSSCLDCIFLVIRENASTDNPVHEIVNLGDGDEDASAMP